MCAAGRLPDPAAATFRNNVICVLFYTVVVLLLARVLQALHDWRQVLNGFRVAAAALEQATAEDGRLRSKDRPLSADFPPEAPACPLTSDRVAFFGGQKMEVPRPPPHPPPVTERVAPLPDAEPDLQQDQPDPVALGRVLEVVSQLCASGAGVRARAAAPWAVPDEDEAQRPGVRSSCGMQGGASGSGGVTKLRTHFEVPRLGAFGMQPDRSGGPLGRARAALGERPAAAPTALAAADPASDLSDAGMQSPRSSDAHLVQLRFELRRERKLAEQLHGDVEQLQELCLTRSVQVESLSRERVVLKEQLAAARAENERAGSEMQMLRRAVARLESEKQRHAVEAREAQATLYRLIGSLRQEVDQLQSKVVAKTAALVRAQEHACQLERSCTNSEIAAIQRVAGLLVKGTCEPGEPEARRRATQRRLLACLHPDKCPATRVATLLMQEAQNSAGWVS